MLGNDVLNQDLAPGRSHGRHIGARFNLVGDDGIGAAGEAVYPTNFDHVGAGAHDVGSHGV